MRPPSASLVFAVLGGVFACAALTPLDPGTCGNGVIDTATEDCDGFPLNADGLCRPPGAPGACRADCTTSSDGKSANVCPSGWRCGNDRICRAPTGAFASPVVVAPTARRVLIEDLDGDGRSEIVAVSDPDARGFSLLRVDFFDAQLSLVKETLLDVPTQGALTSPSDITFIAPGQGIASLRGRQDRTFELVSRSTTADSIRALLYRSDINEVLGVIRSNQRAAYILAPLTGPDVGFELFDFKDPQQVPLIASARLAATDPCETMGYAFPLDTGLHVRMLCNSDGSWNLGDAVVLPFPYLQDAARYMVDARPVFADVDGDKVAELLVTAAGQTYVAHRDGDGGFAKSKLDVLYLRTKTGSTSPVPLLAVADLNADGVPDYATNGVLFVSGSASGGSPLYQEVLNDDSWSEAAFADLNGDARIDVIGASATHAQLTFVQNGADGLVGTPIPTTAIPKNLAVLDLDGDLFNDVVFAESRSTQSNLNVLFGRPGLPGPIETALPADSTAAVLVERSSAGSVATPIAPPEPSRLAVANGVATADGPASSLSYLEVTSGRQWVSPAFLANERALAIAIASKPGFPSTRLALGITSQGTKWHPQLFDADRPELPLVDIAQLAGTVTTRDQLPRAALVMGDTDGDGLANAIALYAPTSGAKAFLIVMRDPGDQHTAWTVDSITRTTRYIDDLTQLALEDVDGDSFPDLIALEATGGPSPHELSVSRNDGQGGFAAAQQVAGFLDDDIQSFTFIAVAPSAPRSLAYVATASFGDRPIVFEQLRGNTFHPIYLPNSTAKAPTSIASGDIDGDGLADIVYADSAGIHVARAIPSK